MRRTQISMTEAQAEALRRLASVRAQSQSALLREALDALLSAETRTSRAQRARDVLGSFRSGTHTTSERHDDALDEAFSP